jgi:hypothetical protein
MSGGQLPLQGTPEYLSVLQDPADLLVKLAFFLGGWALLIWGCVNYMRWKGYSGWFGLFGYLTIPGLIILACFPNRRRRLLQEHGSEHSAEIEALSEQDRRSGHRFLLMLVPFAVVFVTFAGLLSFAGSSIDPAEWKEVTPAGIGFQALMPGAPRVEQKIQETPVGKMELHKFTVVPKGKNELFMVVSVRFPEEASDRLGGAEKLLESGREDLLVATQGQLRSERRIILSGRPGMELEILPPKGAIVKARVYATKNQLYEVFVGVPMIRVTSEDVQKFFDSFELPAEPGATAGIVRRRDSSATTALLGGSGP